MVICVRLTVEGVPIRRALPSAFGAPIGCTNREPNGLNGLLIAMTINRSEVGAFSARGCRRMVDEAR